MNKDIFQIISYVCFAMGGTLVVIAVILFFKFRVRYLIEKLSGKNEVKQVREIRSSIGKASKKVAYELFQTDDDTELLSDESTVILQSSTKRDDTDIVLLQDVIEIHTEERI